MPCHVCFMLHKPSPSRRLYYFIFFGSFLLESGLRAILALVELDGSHFLNQFFCFLERSFSPSGFTSSTVTMGSIISGSVVVSDAGAYFMARS